MADFLRGRCSLLRILVALKKDEAYAENFMMALLPRGYEVYIVEGHDVLLKIAEEHHPQVIVFDSDAESFGGIEGLRALKQVPAAKAAYYIIFSKMSGLEFVKTTMKIGVSGYLYKPITAEGLREHLYRMLEEVEQRTGNWREFVRVKPYPFEEATLELDIPGVESISGEILDISLGGVAFRLARPERIGAIIGGQTYSSMRISLDEHGSVSLAATAVLARGNSAAFQFSRIDEDSLRVLCRYIHEKLIRRSSDRPQDECMRTV